MSPFPQNDKIRSLYRVNEGFVPIVGHVLRTYLLCHLFSSKVEVPAPHGEIANPAA
jgi:hypothetical protein